MKQKVGSLLLIANTNKSLNCGYRSNLTHSWILKHFGVENNHFKTHLAQELNKKWKAQNCSLKHKLGYGFGELLMIVNINIILNCVKVQTQLKNSMTLQHSSVKNSHLKIQDKSNKQPYTFKHRIYI